MKPQHFALALLFSGCGSSEPQPSSTATPPVVVVDAGAVVTYPAAHADPPIALTQGGPTITSPKVVFIMFAGDPFTAEITNLAANVATAGDYWKNTMSEYGIGPLSASLVTFNETPAATIDSTNIEAWLRAKLVSGADAGAGPRLPLPDDRTIYEIFYPARTTLTYVGSTSCSTITGFHSHISAANSNAFYAAIPRCPANRFYTELELMTQTATSQLVGAVTNPRVNDLPAYNRLDADHFAWETQGNGRGGELGEACAARATYKPAGLGLVVQRVWSNAASRASKDPCQPNPLTPYFAAAPRLTDTITVMGKETKGLKIAVGETKTITVDNFSEGPVDREWTVEASDYIGDAGLGQELKFEWPAGNPLATNGRTLQVRVTALKAPRAGHYAFAFSSFLSARRNSWFCYGAN